GRRRDAHHWHRPRADGTSRYDRRGVWYRAARAHGQRWIDTSHDRRRVIRQDHDDRPERQARHAPVAPTPVHLSLAENGPVPLCARGGGNAPDDLVARRVDETEADGATQQA